MIDDKIQRTLYELEQQLRGIDSAHKQVKTTVSAFEELQNETSAYVRNLGRIQESIHSIVSLLEHHNKEQTFAIEKDREQIIKSCNTAIEQLSTATQDAKESINTAISSFNNKLNIIIGLNIVAVVVVVLCLLSK